MIVKTPSCGACGAQMKARMKTLSPAFGELFWGCSNFPNCRNTQPFDYSFSSKDDKALHKAIHDSVWGYRGDYSGAKGWEFTKTNYNFITSKFPDLSPEDFISWALVQMKRYNPGDLHNHNLDVGSPHTESLAGFVAFLKTLIPNSSFFDSEISGSWMEIISKIKTE